MQIGKIQKYGEIDRRELVKYKNMEKNFHKLVKLCYELGNNYYCCVARCIYAGVCVCVCWGVYGGGGICVWWGDACCGGGACGGVVAVIWSLLIYL